MIIGKRDELSELVAAFRGYPGHVQNPQKYPDVAVSHKNALSRMLKRSSLSRAGKEELARAQSQVSPNL
jgi:hypothetical protein